MMAGLGSSSRPLASAEAVAFRQSSYVLLDAITEPEVFVWKLYSDGIVTETSRDRVCSKCTRLERNSVLLEVLESRIKTSPQTYHQVVSLCDDPILQSVRNQLRSAYGKSSHIISCKWANIPLHVNRQKRCSIEACSNSRTLKM